MTIVTTVSILFGLVGVIGAVYFAGKAKTVSQGLSRLVISATGQDASLDSMEKILAEIENMRLTSLRLEAIVSATPFPMLTTNIKGEIVSANQAGFDLLEISNRTIDDFKGQSVSAFFYNDPKRPSVTQKVLESRAAIRGVEATLKTRKDKTIHVLVDAGPIIMKSGELLGAFSIAVDITRQKQAELDVKQRNDALGSMKSDAERLSARLVTSFDAFRNSLQDIQDKVVGNETIAQNIHGFVSRLKDSFIQFNENLEPVISGIDTLNTGLKKIEDATANIKAISDQTDILALNARIEAERSSSSNSSNEGFKIVAKEVKELAIKTKEITGEIMQINHHIRNVTDSSSQALGVMKEKFDSLSDGLTSNTMSRDLSTVSSEIKTMLFQIHETIRELGDATMNLNNVIKSA